MEKHPGNGCMEFFKVGILKVVLDLMDSMSFFDLTYYERDTSGPRLCNMH